MKVFNLTDVETAKLKQHGLVDQSFAVGDKLIVPGGSEEVAPEQEQIARHNLEHLLEVGAAAIDELPPTYKPSTDDKEGAPPDQSAVPQAVETPAAVEEGAPRAQPDAALESHVRPGKTRF